LNAGLQSALANPRGICNPAFGAIVPPIYVAGDANRFFGTLNSSSGAFGRVSALPFQPAGMAFDSGRRVFWVSSSDRLLYTLDPDTGIATVVGLISGTNTDVNGLAFDSASSTLYGFVQSSGQLLGINTATGVATPIGAPTGGNVGALDFDAMRGVIVGIDDAPGGSRLVRFNPLSGIKTTIGILGAGITDCNALAFNPSDGQLYTLNASTDQLLRVNPITGSASALGPTGMFFGSTFAMGCTTPCAADFDSDGTLDFFDYDAFLRCFEIGDCPEGPPPRSADFDGDGSIDFFDYDEFVRLFEAGC
jgi:hypothetical protein